MNRLPQILLTTLMITASGCVTNVTRHNPYANFIDRPVPLERDAILYKTDHLPIEPGFFWIFMGPREELYMAETNDQFGLKTKVADIPKGTPVSIKKVFYVVGDGYFSIKTRGTISFPSLGTNVTFFYTWGNGDELFRAPWEDDSIPEKRALAGKKHL